MGMEVDLRTVLVSSDGGTIDVVAADGEVLASIGIPPGRVQAADYFDILPPGAHFEVSKGLAAMQPRSGVVKTGYGRDAILTDANPDFQPTQVSEMERQMRAAMSHMMQVSTRLERREAAQEDVQRRREEFEQTTAQAAKQAAVDAAAKRAADDAADAVVV